MKVLVTGSTSMIGTQVVKLLKEEGKDVFEFPHNRNFDLLDYDSTESHFLKYYPDVVIHLAGKNGGLAMNQEMPTTIFYNTVTMGLNVINASVAVGVKKFIFIVPSCALDPNTSEACEDDLYRGLPHPSVECHGGAKRAVETYLRQAEKKFGMKAVTCIANNSFGPLDNFSSGGKVISGMIKKFHDAKMKKEKEVILWGTGQPLREFIYCKDIARGLVDIVDIDNIPSPINLTSDYEISIFDLAYKIKNFVGYDGDIIFDTSKPDGQMRKKMSSVKMKQYLNIEITPFDEALQETINWFIGQRNASN